MTKSKSLIYIILTLLPCVLILITLAHGLLADQPLSFNNFQFGYVVLEEVEEGIQISYTDNSICSSILSAFVKPGQIFLDGTAAAALFGSMQIVSEAVGFTQIPAAVILASFYMMYFVFLYFVNSLVDLITLVPKLVERAFNL